jgi:hypothetical protein
LIAAFQGRSLPMAKRRRPTVLLDEHVHDEIAIPFREVGFRVIFARNDRRYRGRDEHDYIGELYAANEVFVTSDFQFIRWILHEHGTRHAGLVMLPRGTDELRELFAAVCAGWMWGSTDRSPIALRGKILFWSYEGLQQVDDESRIKTAVGAHLLTEEI